MEDLNENVSYDIYNQVTTAKFSGFVRQPEFEAISMDGIKLRASMKGTKLLAHVAEMKVMTKSIQEWVQNTWFPAAMKTNLKVMAFVIPKMTTAQMSMKNTNKDAPIPIGYFKTEEEALNFLNQN